MPEKDYLNPNYCLECMEKHSNRLEHHLEDLVTATKDNPALRSEAQDLLDRTRELRKAVDELRIREIAKLKETA